MTKHSPLALLPLSLALLAGCSASADDDDSTGGLHCPEGAEGAQLAADDPGPASPRWATRFWRS